MWKSITYVSSGLTLVAFIIAAASWTYRESLLRKAKLIRQASESDRAKLVEKTLEFFDVETIGLTKQQQYNLALRQVHARAVRFRTTAVVIVITALLATSVSIFALWRDKSGEKSAILDPTPTPTFAPSPTLNLNSSTLPSPMTSPSPTASVTPSPLTLSEQKQVAQKFISGWWAACLHHDVTALIQMSELPFYFGHEFMVRPEDLRKDYEAVCAEESELLRSRITDIKVETVSERKAGGYDLEKDKVLKNLTLSETDFAILVTIEEKGDNPVTAVLNFYARNHGKEIKLVGLGD